MPIDDDERESFERQDPRWRPFHLLFDQVEDRSIDFDAAFSAMLRQAADFLSAYDEKERLEEIIVAFENLINMMLFQYPDRMKPLYEDDEWYGKILHKFNSLIFDYDWQTQIDELREMLKQ